MSLLSLLPLLLKHRVALFRAAVALLILVLLLVCWQRGKRISGLEAALAAKPQIVEKVVTVEKVRTVVKAGPERVVEKIVYQPGGVEIVEREIWREPVETVTEAAKETAQDRQEGPSQASLGVAPRRFLIGLSAPILAPSNGIVARAGVTFWNRVDVVADYHFIGPREYRAWGGANFRF